jgi:hypothetical protein
VAFLQKVLPGRDPAALVEWVKQVCAVPLDVEAVAAALPSFEERLKALQFAARMALKDGEVQDTERDLLRNLAVGLDLRAEVVDDLLADMAMRGRKAEYSEGALIAALDGTDWDAVQVLDEAVTGPIGQVAPPGSVPVRAVALDDVVVLAFYVTGIAARFQEGVAFAAWTDLVGWSRMAAMGSAVQLHVEDGRSLTLVDGRLGGLVHVLQRLLGVRERKRGVAPAIQQLRGAP